METLCQGKQPTEAVDSVDRFITNQSPMENSWFSFGNCENSKEVLTFPLTTSLACTCLGVHHKLTTESLCFTRVYVTLLQKKTYIVCIYTCMHTHTAYCTYIIILYIYTYMCVCVCMYINIISYTYVCLCVVCVCVFFYIGQISGPAICTLRGAKGQGRFAPALATMATGRPDPGAHGHRDQHQKEHGR